MPCDEDAMLALSYGMLLGQFNRRVQVGDDQSRRVSRDAVNTPGLGCRNHCAVPSLCGPWDPGSAALSIGSERRSEDAETLMRLQALPNRDRAITRAIRGASV